MVVDSEYRTTRELQLFQELRVSLYEMRCATGTDRRSAWERTKQVRARSLFACGTAAVGT